MTAKTREQKAAKAARRQARRFESATFIGPDEQRRCKRDGKISFTTLTRANQARLMADSREVDPGMVVYPCEFCLGFHLGHEGGFKSLQRLLEEAGAIS